MSFIEPLISANAAAHSVPFSDAKMGDIMNRSDLKSMVPQPKSYKKGPFTVEASGYSKVDGETIPRRHPLAKDNLILKPSDDVNTVYDILRRSSGKFGNAKALGYRTLIKTHDEIKQITKVVDGKETTQDKKWTFFELSGYTYISFTEYEKLVHSVGAGFRALGMKAEDRVHIFASTSPWWLAIAHGMFHVSVPRIFYIPMHPCAKNASSVAFLSKVEDVQLAYVRRRRRSASLHQKMRTIS